jgi:hypothetical protein
MGKGTTYRAPLVGPRPALALFATATLAVEGMLLFLTAMSRLAPIYLITVHTIIVGVLFFWLVLLRRMGSDTSSATFFLIATAVAGPFGAIGGLLIDWLSQQRAEHIDRLQFWYDRIALSTQSDAVTQLSDHVAMGRAVDLGAPAPLSFAGLIETGTIAEKQSILGLIARRFHPDYLPTIKAALISPEPVIRVQAAAVAARIRGDLGPLTKRLLATAEADRTQAGEAVVLADQVRQCVTSGLMEEKDVDRLLRSLAELDARLQSSVLSAKHRIGGRATKQSLAFDDADARSAFEEQLISQGRYAEFRALRRAQAWPKRGVLRYRPMPRPLRVRSGSLKRRGLS